MTLKPASCLRGTFVPPGDKSISHRAAILASLAQGVSTLRHFLGAEDCLRTAQAFQAMGVRIVNQRDTWRIFGKGLRGFTAPRRPIDCGNSGTTARLLMGVLAGQPFQARLVGDASLSRRPMRRVLEPLRKMGAAFQARAGNYLPIDVQGTLHVRAIRYRLPTASAQVKSAILLAGLYAEGKTSVVEPSPSRDHTERMLAACGVHVERSGRRLSLNPPLKKGGAGGFLRGKNPPPSPFFKGGSKSAVCNRVGYIRPLTLRVPGDLSSAAFFVAAASLLPGSRLLVRQVGVNPTRTGFLDVLKKMGAGICLLNRHVSGGEPMADLEVRAAPLLGFPRVEGSLIPRLIDEIPILAVVAAQAMGLTEISDARELRIKESDRIATMVMELSKMGARIQSKPDGLRIWGPTPLSGARVRSHGDHRVAMALAVAALVARGKTVIEDIGCVQTSFPWFWKELKRLCKYTKRGHKLISSPLEGED